MTVAGHGRRVIHQAFQRWKSLPSRNERLAMFLLALICLSAVFSTAIVQSLVVILAVVLLSWHLLGPPCAWQHTPLDVPYLLFVAGRVISIAFSQYPAESIRALYLEYFFYVIFFLVTQSIRRDEVVTAQMLTLLLIGAGVMAGIVGVVKVLFLNELRGSSTTAGPYTLGAYLCPVLSLALFLPRQGMETRWSRFGLLCICAGILSTLDRLHWAGMALILMATALLSRNRTPFVALSSLLIPALLLPRVRFRIAQLVHLNSFMAGRDVLWQGALLLITRHPIVGFGPRTFSLIFPLFAEMPVQGVGSWHNDYLQVYLDSGLLGLLPLLYLIGATYYYTWQTLREKSLPVEVRALMYSLLASLSTIILLGGMLDTHVGIVFRVLLGLLALLMRLAPRRNTPLPALAES